MALSDRLNPSIPLASRNVGGLGAALEAGREDARRNQLFELAKEDRTRRQGFEDQDRAAAQQAAQAQQNLESIAVGAVEVKPLLDNIGSIPRAVNVLTRRIQEIEARQGDASDTREVLEMIQAGRIDQARAAVDSAIQAAEAQGIIKRPGGDVSDPSAVREFQFFQGLSPEKQEQFIKVKRASGQIVDIAGVPNIVNRETGTTTPLSTPQAEIGAAAEKVGAVETAKQEAQLDAIPEKVRAQYEAEFKAEAPKRIRAANDAIARIDSVMEEAQLAIDDIGITTTGLLGSINRKIAGTSAFALARKVETIQANLSFDRIAEMRKNSPTGGALGQVSERELVLLGASVVALNQANSEQEVKRAFTKILFHYNNWKAVLTGQIDADEMLREGSIDVDELTEPAEGDTATDAQGNKLQLVNGQWVQVNG